MAEETFDAGTASVFSAPTPPTPIVLAIEDVFGVRTVSVGDVETINIDFYSVYDEDEYEATKAQLAAVEKVLPFVSNEDDRRLLDGLRTEMIHEIEAWEMSEAIED